MRKLLLVVAALLIALLSGCGGKGTETSAGSSPVKLKLGDKALAAIPASVTTVAITITAPDIPTINRTVTVAGRSEISESFAIPNGPNRTITVVARDAQGNVQFSGTAVINLQGVPITVDIPVRNVGPPVFAGLAAATALSSTSVALSWSPASDNLTPAAKMVYLIYVATAPGREGFTSPSYTTPEGATSFTATALTPGTTYYFVVRALNKDGLMDSNTVEVSATTLPGTPPLFAGLTSAVADPTVTGRITLSWSPASDDATPAARILYLVYMSTTPGGENLFAASFPTAPGATSLTINGLSPGTYYFIVRAQDESGNIDSNTVERSATTTVPGMTIAAGSPQATAVGAAFPTPLRVLVTDAAGNPVSGAAVTFSAPALGASGTFPNGTTAATVATDASGIAATTLTANGATGTYSVTASSAGLAPLAFSLTNTAGPAASIVVRQGSNQSAPIGTPFFAQLQVTVTDAFENLVPNTGVVFTALPIFGTVTSATFPNGTSTATVFTDPNGIAAAPALTAGGITGIYTVTAATGSLPPAVFTLRNVLPPLAVAPATPLTVTLPVGTVNTGTFSVIVTPEVEEPPAGMWVLFTAPTSGASGTFPNSHNFIGAQTDGNGQAVSPSFTTNGIPGTYTVTATVVGTSRVVNFTVTNF